MLVLPKKPVFNYHDKIFYPNNLAFSAVYLILLSLGQDKLTKLCISYHERHVANVIKLFTTISYDFSK
jgi:hypothetical protein